MISIKTMYIESQNLAKKRNKQLQFAGLVLIICALIGYRQYGIDERFTWMMAFVFAFTTLTYLIPPVIIVVLSLWFLLGKLMGEIMSYVLLSVLYFLLIWPAKFFVSKATKGNWIAVERDQEDFEKMG